nr:reverse transcriptase domain, reverse transcriptase zinc-binding domain protein [Tanacetum cinerariifolium]
MSIDKLQRFSGLALIQVPTLHDDTDDVLVWRDMEGIFRPFSVACAWDSIRLRDDVVDWFHVVWLQMRGLSGMDVIPPRLADVVSFLVLISKGRSVTSVVSRLLLAATSYYLWIERNLRLFRKKKSTVSQLVEAIVSCSPDACYLQVQEGFFPLGFFLGRSFKEADSDLLRKQTHLCYGLSWTPLLFVYQAVQLEVNVTTDRTEATNRSEPNPTYFGPVLGPPFKSNSVTSPVLCKTHQYALFEDRTDEPNRPTGQVLVWCLGQICFGPVWCSALVVAHAHVTMASTIRLISHTALLV